jgi:hypothetical protein
MDNRKYIGMDVHQASISIAVGDAAGKVLMECILETMAEFRGEPVEVRPRENLTDARPGIETIVEILRSGRQRMRLGSTSNSPQP